MNAERASYRLGELQVLRRFGRGFVQGFQRGARELELAAGLQRNSAAPGRVLEADDSAVVEVRLPTGFAGDAIEQSLNAIGSGIGNRTDRAFVEHVLFVLGADCPALFRLVPTCQHFDQVGARFDQRRMVVVAGHAVSLEPVIKRFWRRGGRTISPAKPKAILLSPIADDRLNERQRGHCGGIGPQDAWTKTDWNYKGLTQ